MRHLLAFITAATITSALWSQSPEKISYQAVIRDAKGILMINAPIGMQISIVQGAVDGTAVFVERHFPTTNENGLVSLEIGSGTLISGNFTTIDWANDKYFIKTETDLKLGSNYTITGTSQFLSVPYAMHSKTAESVIGTSPETDPVYISSQAANISAADITNLSNLSGTNTGDQDLSAFLTTEVDPEFIASQAANIGAEDIINLSNLSGTNTGDQDLSAFLTTEVDPEFIASQAANISAADITNLSNLSGINTGDQDLSAYLAEEADPTWNGAANQSGTIGRTGNVGIGTTSPSSKLHVAGSVRIVNGTQGNLRMLQSDANGNASWVGGPGVDWIQSGSGGTVSTSSSTSNVTSVTISAPGPGYVIVTGSGSLYHNLATTGSFLARIKVSNTANDVEEGSGGIQFIRQTSFHTSSMNIVHPFSVSKVYPVSSTGTHRFYLNVWHQSVNGSLTVDDYTLIAHFVPNRL